MARKATITEVDQTNFQQVKSQVFSSLRKAMFVAFDCEFTGLHRERQQGVNVLLTAKNRYAQLRQTMFGGGFLMGKCSACGMDQLEGANFCHHCGTKRSPADTHAQHQTGTRRQEFLIAQVGLSCFIFNEESKSYDIRCYSFYLSPRPWTGHGQGSSGNVKVEHDIKFSCMGSSLKFLGDHAFNFNRWINEGIPFMSRQQYQMEREKLRGRGNATYASSKDLDAGKGFLEIWDALIFSGKPLIGHQCFLDMLYLWHQLEAPLHKDLKEVFRDINSKVKVLVDTKHVLSWYPRDLSNLFEREAVGMRQRKLEKLKAELAEKERQRKIRSERQTPPPAVSPNPDTQPAGEGSTADDPQAGIKSPTRRRADELSELLDKKSEIMGVIRENVCKEMQRQLTENEDLGNVFCKMHLHELYKLLFPLIQDSIPQFAPKEHDAGYDAYMTGAVFLGIFTLMYGDSAQPNAKFLTDNHTGARKLGGGKRATPPESGTPQSLAFLNKLYIFAAPYHLDTSGALPTMDESHATTFTVDPPRADGSSVIDSTRLQSDLRKVDQFAELYWVDFKRRAVVVLFRRDVPPVELYRILSHALQPLHVSPVVTPKPVPRTLSKSPTAAAAAGLSRQTEYKKLKQELATAERQKAAAAASKPKSPPSKPSAAKAAVPAPAPVAGGSGAAAQVVAVATTAAAAAAASAKPAGQGVSSAAPSSEAAGAAAASAAAAAVAADTAMNGEEDSPSPAVPGAAAGAAAGTAPPPRCTLEQLINTPPVPRRRGTKRVAEDAAQGVPGTKKR